MSRRLRSAVTAVLAASAVLVAAGTLAGDSVLSRPEPSAESTAAPPAVPVEAGARSRIHSLRRVGAGPLRAAEADAKRFLGVIESDGIAVFASRRGERGLVLTGVDVSNGAERWRGGRWRIHSTVDEVQLYPLERSGSVLVTGLAGRRHRTAILLEPRTGRTIGSFGYDSLGWIRLTLDYVAAVTPDRREVRVYDWRGKPRVRYRVPAGLNLVGYDFSTPTDLISSTGSIWTLLSDGTLHVLDLADGYRLVSKRLRHSRVEVLAQEDRIAIIDGARLTVHDMEPGLPVIQRFTVRGGRSEGAAFCAAGRICVFGSQGQAGAVRPMVSVYALESKATWTANSPTTYRRSWSAALLASYLWHSGELLVEFAGPDGRWSGQFYRGDNERRETFTDESGRLVGDRLPGAFGYTKRPDLLVTVATVERGQTARVPFYAVDLTHNRLHRLGDLTVTGACAATEARLACATSAGYEIFAFAR